MKKTYEVVYMLNLRNFKYHLKSKNLKCRSYSIQCKRQIASYSSFELCKLIPIFFKFCKLVPKNLQAALYLFKIL